MVWAQARPTLTQLLFLSLNSEQTPFHRAWGPGFPGCSKGSNNVNWKTRSVDSLGETLAKWKTGEGEGERSDTFSSVLPSWMVLRHSFLGSLFGDISTAGWPAVPLCGMWISSWHGNVSPYIYLPSFSLTVQWLHLSIKHQHLSLVSCLFSRAPELRHRSLRAFLGCWWYRIIVDKDKSTLKKVINRK